MDILFWYHRSSARVRTVRATCVVLLGLTTVRGLQFSACGSDGLKEVMADQTINFTCGTEGKMEWRLLLNGNLKSYNLATREGNIFSASGLFGKTFKISVMDAYYTLLVINAANNREIYDFVHILNGSLECTRVVGQEIIERASCHLSYVAPPEQVSCNAVSSSWYVQVSCVIGSVYSSRRNYMCHLLRLNNGIKNETLETVTMVTSPTSEKIAEKEVKVSGSCQFVTTHPAEEGRYRFFVSVSPGGRIYPATFTNNNEWIMTSRPRPPHVACDPQPYVLENTNVSCACSTTSLGQPPGSLRWIVGDQTGKGIPARKEQQVQTSQEVHYSQSLTLSDHGATWFRCDVSWGSQEIRGEIYIASVGYAARTPLFSLNDEVSQHTIKEGDKIHFRCESDGRPPSQVYVYNHDNGTVIGRNSSFVNYVSVAGCEDTGTYTCSAWNGFSNLSNLTNSISVDVKCKPRLHRLLPVHLGKVDTETKTLTCNFDVLAYPAPHQYNLWEPKRNSSEASNNEMSKIMNISCEPDTRRRYVFRCTLTIFNIPSPPVTSMYKIQIINEVGEEIFPTEICYAKAVGVDFQCPSLFNEGENILTCKINTTAIKEAHCSSMYSDVMFEWIANSGKGVGCQSIYNPQQKCTSGEQHRPGSCWCEDSSGEIITYKFSYQANSTSDRGRQFECNLCVLPQKPLNISSSEGCANISFADSKADIGVQSSKSKLIIGIVIGLLGVILLIILSILMRKKFPCSCFHKEKKKADIESKDPLNPIPEEEKKSNRPEQNGHSSVLIINGT